MKYEADIYCEEVAHDANIGYGIQIRNNFENSSKLMTSLFEDIEKHNIACILVKKYEAEI